MLKSFTVQQGKLVESGQERPGVWVFVNPDENERRMLVSDLRLDEHTLGCALDPEEPARLEFEPEHVAVIIKRPKHYSEKDSVLFRVASTGLFLFKDLLVVVISEDVPLFVGKVFNSVESVEDVFLKIIYGMIYHFLEHLRVINLISDEIERKISRSMENRYLLKLFSLEKSLVYYLNAINSNGFVCEKVKNNGPKIGFSTRGQELIDDILIENSQCYRQAEIYSNILASLMDARVSIVSNNLNILMKTLNFVTILIMVPTLVVSAFSMNVTIPMAKCHPAFWIILCFAGISAVGVMLWWKRANFSLTASGEE